MHHIYTYHIVRHWAALISATSFSRRLQNAPWVVPTSQSIHIVCLSIVFASVLMIDLRLLGIGRSKRCLSDVARLSSPWIYRGLLLLLLTGSLQTVVEPTRQFVAPAFWWKMLMIACALCLTIGLSRAIQADPGRWDAEATRPAAARPLALLSLGLWVGIIICGRFIGYTWSLHV
jgi:hypothetical protein